MIFNASLEEATSAITHAPLAGAPSLLHTVCPALRQRGAASLPQQKTAALATICTVAARKGSRIHR